MPSPYTVTRSKTATMASASTAETVTVTDTIRKLQVLNFDSSSRLSVTYNGATPTVDGDNTIPVPPGGSVTLYDATETEEESVPLDQSSDHVVKLISAGTPTYAVVGF